MTSGPENDQTRLGAKKPLARVMSGGTGIRPTPHHLASAQNDPVFTTSEPVSIGEIEDFIDANAEWAVVNHRLQQDIAAGRVKPEASE